MLTRNRIPQRHRDELLPPLAEPPAELLAQAALFIALRDQPPPSSLPTASSPWVRLSARRFGGDVSTRTIAFETETGTALSVHISTRSDGSYDITTPSAHFSGVSAVLDRGSSTLTATLAGALIRATVIPQPHGTAAGAERLHVFCGQRATTVLRLAPAWAEALSADTMRTAAPGALRAPMPSLVVEVRVVVGQRVEKGQAVVVLESMKTETVLRAPTDGVVRAVGCAKGEMVEEGRELVDIEETDV